MAELDPIHADLAGYLLDRLEPDERERFERHLETCESCQAEMSELAGTAALRVHGDLAIEPPPDLRRRTLAAVERAMANEGPAEGHGAPERSAGAGPTGPAASPVAGQRAARRPRRPLLPRLALGLGVLAALAAAVVVGATIGGPGAERAEGELEAEAVLTGPGSDRGTARVVELGIGRAVTLRSDDLPELDNEKEFYELWFVGRDDRPGDPNRVSGGTFHPDGEGRSRVRLTAAVDPANYAALSVTREPRNGDPGRTGPEVLGSRLAVE